MTETRHRTPLALLAAAAALTALAGCGSPSTPAAADPATPTTSAAADGPTSDAALARGGCRRVGAPAPAPAGPAVITVTGRVAGGAPVALDMARLDAMPQVECTVDDRQAEGRTATFSGPLLADVLADVGAQPDTTLHTLALNDYAVDLPVSDVRELPMLLATRLDGAPMSVAHYGPTRVVYPTTGYDLDKTVYDPRWVWQLASVDVA